MRGQRHTRRLTKTILDNLRTAHPIGERIFDSEIPGFGVVVRPSGRRTFFYIYGPMDVRRYITIGHYGVFTLDEARERARKLAGKVADGADPQATKRAALAIPTFTAWAESYIETVKPHKRSWRQDETKLQWAAAQLKGKPLTAITKEDVERLVALARSKGVAAPTASLTTERARSAATLARKRWKDAPPRDTTANRFLACLRTCLRAAWEAGHIPENPAMRVRLLPEGEPRQRVLDDAEMGRLSKAVAALADGFAQTAFILLLETGCRSSEALRARWDDFNLADGLWRIPSPKSRRKGESIPLSAHLVAYLKTAPRLDGCPYLVPGRTAFEHRFDLKGPWADLLKAAKLEGVHIHDIRRSVGLALARAAGLHIASKVLRHSSIAVTEKIYAPLAHAELKGAVDKVSRKRGKLLKFSQGEGK